MENGEYVLINGIVMKPPIIQWSHVQGVQMGKIHKEGSISTEGSSTGNFLEIS